jgi:hypothetical protein
MRRSGDLSMRYCYRVAVHLKTPRSRHRDALAEEVIVAILETVRSMPDSPQKRQLGAKAATYQRVLQSWGASPPTDSQRAALRDQILQLHAKLVEVLRRDSLDLTPAGGVRRFGGPVTLSIGKLRRLPDDD